MQAMVPSTGTGLWRSGLGLAAALGLSAFACAQAGGDLRPVAPGPRQSGPLTVSLQNEVDAAIDRGQAWLAVRQASDGSWEGSNRVDLTAAVWLALSAGASPDVTSAVARAWSWIERQTNAEDRAWLRLVRAVHTHDAAATDRVCSELLTAWTPAGQERLPADCWPLLWLRARQVNHESASPRRTTGTVSLPANWRSSAARQIVNSQLAAPELPGTGFWRAADGNDAGWSPDPVARTCFALLVLQEL